MQLEDLAFGLVQPGDFFVEFRPHGELIGIVRLLRRIVVPRRITPLKIDDLLAVPALLPRGHVQQHLANLVCRQPKEFGDRMQFDLLERLGQPHPGFVDHAVEIVLCLEAGE